MLRIEWHRRAACVLALAGLALAGMRDAGAQGSPPQGEARLDPPEATVRVGESLMLTPSLAARPAGAARPLPNAASGDRRVWMVNGIPQGNGSFGTIRAQGAVGATFTAPAVPPTPATVTVTFAVTPTGAAGAGAATVASARITITDGGSTPDRNASRRRRGSEGDDTTTWTATVLKSPSTVFFAERGGVRVSAKMTSLVMTCLNAPGPAPTPCNGEGSFFVQSESTPGDGSCRSRMDPPSLHIDFKPNASDTNFVMLRYVDPAPGAPAGDYEGWGALEWTADVVVEQDPAGKTACVNAGRRPKQDFVVYVLNTGMAGAGQFSRGMKTLSGRCAAAGGLGLQGGECTGEEEPFVWSFQRNAAAPR